MFSFKSGWCRLATPFCLHCLLVLFIGYSAPPRHSLGWDVRISLLLLWIRPMGRGDHVAQHSIVLPSSRTCIYEPFTDTYQYVLVHTGTYYLILVCTSRAIFQFHTIPFPSPQSTYYFIRTCPLLFFVNFLIFLTHLQAGIDRDVGRYTDSSIWSAF